jgi:hypothetical protein
MLKQDKIIKNIPVIFELERSKKYKIINAPPILKGRDFSHNRDEDSFKPKER